MPFLTETLALQLWQRAPERSRSTSLVVAKWPDAGPRDGALAERFATLVDVVRTIRNLRQEAGLDPSDRARVLLAGDVTAIRELAPAIAGLTRSDVAFGSGEGTATVVGVVEVRLVAARDASAERARLERELAEARQLATRSRELLAKPGFAERAPTEVVTKERAKLAEREQRVRLLEEETRKRRS